MKFIRYDITLRRIQLSDIEKLRQWRNSDAIRKKMIFQEYITKKMQLEWFKNIENSYHSSYYIISYKGNDVGVLNQKNFRLPGKMRESGIFIVNEKYINSHIPVIASITMIEASFYAMQKTESFVRVLKNNQEAFNYNYSLGYKIFKEEKDHFIMRLTLDDYLSKTKKLRKAIKNLYKKSQLEFYLEPIDFQLGYAPFFRNLIYEVPKKYILQFEETYNSLKIVLDLDIN